LVDEGLVECKIAAGLLPNWDGPAVECGIMLANIGEYEAALYELEQARATLPQSTPHLRFITGYVLTRLERYADALEHLETVTEIRPDFASAHRYAAHCAFKLGDKTTGARHAKAARQLGDFSEYMAWRDGAYSSPRAISTRIPGRDLQPIARRSLSMATAVCSVREVLALTAIAALFPIPELALTVFEHNPIPAGVTLQTGLPALRIGQSDQRAVLDRVLNCGWEYPFIKSSLTIKRSPACWVALRSECG
jgi:tetratricopeptide (TPR) repeat protein